MARTWKTWKKRTPEFRQRALKRMQEESDLGLLAKEFSVCVRTVYRWKEIQLLGRVKPAREPKPPEKKLEEEIQRLKQSLANRTLEVDFFKGVDWGLRPAKSHENRVELANPQRPWP
jgi:transposase-like protein